VHMILSLLFVCWVVSVSHFLWLSENQGKHYKDALIHTNIFYSILSQSWSLSRSLTPAPPNVWRSPFFCSCFNLLTCSELSIQMDTTNS
jgi:hypothetical protein